MRSGRWLAAFLITAAIACSKQYGETAPAPTGDDDDDPPVKTRDAGTTVTTSDSGSTPADAGPQASTTCPSTAPTAIPPFVIPSAPGRPCTADDIHLYLADEGKTFDAAKASMAAQNPSCAACVYTEQTSASWGPVVRTTDGRSFVNFGLCASRAGASQPCATDVFDFEWCRQKVCNICLSGENPSDCLADAQQHVCNDAFVATSNDCNHGEDDIVTNTCGGSGNVVQILCGPASH